MDIRSLAVAALLSVASCGDAAEDVPGRRDAMDNDAFMEAAIDYTDCDMCSKLPMEADGIVRLSKIEVYPDYTDEYVKYAVEVGETSLRTEPGVLAMYALRQNDEPCAVTILEIYASREAYRSHIASEHFKRYKQGTLHMVKSLTLSDQTPLNEASKIVNFIRYDNE